MITRLQHARQRPNRHFNMIKALRDGACVKAVRMMICAVVLASAMSAGAAAQSKSQAGEVHRETRPDDRIGEGAAPRKAKRDACQSRWRRVCRPVVRRRCRTITRQDCRMAPANTCRDQLVEKCHPVTYRDCGMVGGRYQCRTEVKRKCRRVIRSVCDRRLVRTCKPVSRQACRYETDRVCRLARGFACRTASRKRPHPRAQRRTDQPPRTKDTP